MKERTWRRVLATCSLTSLMITIYANFFAHDMLKVTVFSASVTGGESVVFDFILLTFGVFVLTSSWWLYDRFG